MANLRPRMTSSGRINFGVSQTELALAMSAVMDNNEPEVPGPLLHSAALEIGDTSFLEEIAPLRREGDQLFSRKVYQVALGKFKQVAGVIVGDGFEIPLYCGEGGGFRSKKYTETKQAKRLALLKCCVQISQCLQELQDDEQVFGQLLFKQV